MKLRFPISTVWLFFLAAPLSAQQLADRGAFILRRGADTLVVDRFIRTSTSIVGSVQVRGQPRIDYVATIAPGEFVRTLALSIFAAGSSATAAPVQRVRVTMQGDTAIAETATGVQRIATKTGAIPMFNNAIALTEVFLRRARTTGNIADIPWFSLTGGGTTTYVIRPLTADSVSAVLAAQKSRFLLDPIGRIAGGVVEGAGLEFVRAGPSAADGLNVAQQNTPIAPPQDYFAPFDAPYTAEEVRVTGPGGITLGGTLTKPTNARGRLPAVITITGSGQQDRDEFIPFAGGIRMFRQIADTLSRRGMAVLRLDDRGIGASGGDPATSTGADFADDIRAAVAFLRARADIDPARIALVGHSEGGQIAPMVAATDPKLKAIVTMAGPGEAMIEISMAQNKYIVDHDPMLTQAKRDSLLRVARAALAPQRQGNPSIKFWMGYDPAPVMRQVKAATLILQGATDRQVPVDQAEKLAAAIRAGGNTNVTVRVFPEMNHLFIHDADGNFNNYDRLPTNKIDKSVLGALADWLARTLTAGQ